MYITYTISPSTRLMRSLFQVFLACCNTAHIMLPWVERKRFHEVRDRTAAAAKSTAN